MSSHRFFNNFTKITAWPLQKVVFRTRIYYEDRAVQGRRIQGPAIIMSNHTSVFDYACWLFVFFSRTLRVQMAELLFKKKPLGLLLRLLGGIYVNRNARDFGFITESEHILEKGGVVGVFPESRLPLPDEERPLPFVPSCAYLAISSGAPVIPVFTNGDYMSTRHALVMIGTPMRADEFYDDSLSEKENINRITKIMRERIISLGNLLDEACAAEKKQTPFA